MNFMIAVTQADKPLPFTSDKVLEVITNDMEGAR